MVLCEKGGFLIMKFQDLRNELKDYYSKKSYENAKKYLEVKSLMNCMTKVCLHTI